MPKRPIFLRSGGGGSSTPDLPLAAVIVAAWASRPAGAAVTRRRLPAGIRHRGAVHTYTWRDQGRPAVQPQGRRHPGAGRGVQAPDRRPARAGGLPAVVDDDLRDLRHRVDRGRRAQGADPLPLPEHPSPRPAAGLRRLPARQDPPAPGPDLGRRPGRRAAVGQQCAPAHRRAAQLPEVRADRRPPERPAAARRDDALGLLPAADRHHPGRVAGDGRRGPARLAVRDRHGTVHRPAAGRAAGTDPRRP